jgi:hypothetical protein
MTGDRRGDGERRGSSFGAVDIELVLDAVEPVRVGDLLHLLAEVRLADPDLDAVFLDRDLGLAVAVVTLYTRP